VPRLVDDITVTEVVAVAVVADTDESVALGGGLIDEDDTDIDVVVDEEAGVVAGEVETVVVACERVAEGVELVVVVVVVVVVVDAAVPITTGEVVDGVSETTLVVVVEGGGVANVDIGVLVINAVVVVVVVVVVGVGVVVVVGVELISDCVDCDDDEPVISSIHTHAPLPSQKHARLSPVHGVSASVLCGVQSKTAVHVNF
jgi:hypothetical protein